MHSQHRSGESVAAVHMTCLHDISKECDMWRHKQWQTLSCTLQTAVPSDTWKSPTLHTLWCLWNTGSKMQAINITLQACNKTACQQTNWNPSSHTVIFLSPFHGGAIYIMHRAVTLYSKEYTLMDPGCQTHFEVHATCWWSPTLCSALAVNVK